MIDLKAARANADAARAALARKGAGEAFDRLLEADERWRALVPRVDELRGRTKLSGKPTPESWNLGTTGSCRRPTMPSS